MIYKLILLIFCIFGGFMSCSAEERFMILSSAKGGLYKYHFQTGNFSKLSDIKSRNSIPAAYQNISRVDKGSFLFESTEHWIGQFFINDQRNKQLYANASCPTYLEDYDLVLFTRTTLTEQGYKESLHVASLNDKRNSKEVAVLSRGTASYCPIKLSSSMAIVYLSYGKRIKAAIYNSDVGELVPLAIDPDCRPVLAVGANQIICSDADGYYLADLSGQKISDLNKLKKKTMIPLLYLHDRKKLVVQEYKEDLYPNVVANVYLLDVSKDGLERVISDFVIQKGGVVVF